MDYTVHRNWKPALCNLFRANISSSWRSKNFRRKCSIHSLDHDFFGCSENWWIFLSNLHNWGNECDFENQPRVIDSETGLFSVSVSSTWIVKALQLGITFAILLIQLRFSRLLADKLEDKGQRWERFREIRLFSRLLMLHRRKFSSKLSLMLISRNFSCSEGAYEIIKLSWKVENFPLYSLGLWAS